MTYERPKHLTAAVMGRRRSRSASPSRSSTDSDGSEYYVPMLYEHALSGEGLPPSGCHAEFTPLPLPSLPTCTGDEHQHKHKKAKKEKKEHKHKQKSKHKKVHTFCVDTHTALSTAYSTQDQAALPASFCLCMLQKMTSLAGCLCGCCMYVCVLALTSYNLYS